MFVAFIFLHILTYNQTVHEPLDTVDLSSVRGLHEKEDGYEELEGIPFSFALSLSYGGLFNIYTDNQQSKVSNMCETGLEVSLTSVQEQLMSLIIQVCGL